MEIREGGEPRECVREVKGDDLRMQWQAVLSAGEMAGDNVKEREALTQAIDPRWGWHG